MYKESIKSSFGLIILIYCWISHFIWPWIGLYIAKKYANRGEGEVDDDLKQKITGRTLQNMINLQDAEGLVDLITYGALMENITPVCLYHYKHLFLFAF